jgi:hypothetical protein
LENSDIFAANLKSYDYDKQYRLSEVVVPLQDRGIAKNGAYPPTQNGHIRSLLSGRCHDSSFTLQI